MKKITLLLIVTVLLTACGSGKVEREARKTLNGDWTLTEISYPGSSGEFDVTLFADATATCLKNSDWNFVSNNNTGYYVPVNPQCNTDLRYFIWAVNKVDGTGNYDFLLKPTNADHKSTTGNQGYRINIVSLTGTGMIWEHTVNFEGEPFTIRMNFIKK